MLQIPQVKKTDPEDVAWGLQTAETLWRRGERIDALIWLRRAAQAAVDAEDDDRALELGRYAAELTEWMKTASEADMTALDIVTDIDDASGDVEVDEPLPSVGDTYTEDEYTLARKAASTRPPYRDENVVDVDDVADSVDSEDSLESGDEEDKELTQPRGDSGRFEEAPVSLPIAFDDGREDAVSVLPAEKVHAGMFDPWADQAAARGSGPAPAPVPSDPPSEEEVVTSVRAPTPSRPGISEPPAARPASGKASPPKPPPVKPPPPLPAGRPRPPVAPRIATPIILPSEPVELMTVDLIEVDLAHDSRVPARSSEVPSVVPVSVEPLSLEPESAEPITPPRPLAPRPIAPLGSVPPRPSGRSVPPRPTSVLTGHSKPAPSRAPAPLPSRPSSEPTAPPPEPTPPEPQRPVLELGSEPVFEMPSGLVEIDALGAGLGASPRIGPAAELRSLLEIPMPDIAPGPVQELASLLEPLPVPVSELVAPVGPTPSEQAALAERAALEAEEDDALSALEAPLYPVAKRPSAPPRFDSVPPPGDRAHEELDSEVGPHSRSQHPPAFVAADEGEVPTHLDLDDVEAFADLPDDAREAFAAAATIDALGEGEEIGTFALAYVLSGAFDVAATVVDAPAVRLRQGAVLRARGTTEEGVPMRLIGAAPRSIVATWTDAAVEEAFRSIPWVEEDLRALADRVQTLVGITIGPLGERLDMSIREQIVARLTMRTLIPGEIVVSAGQPVPGLLLVGIGELELVKDDKVVGAVTSGDFLFPTEVLGAGDAPAGARAGHGGALVLFGDRSIAQELLVTCPPLLELFAGM